MDTMKQVGTGFRMVYTGLLLIVLSVVIGFLGGCVLGAQGAVGGAAFQLLNLVTGGLSFAGSIVGLIGRFKCLAVPAAAGSAKPLISVSVGLEVIGLLLSILITIDRFGGDFLPLMMKASGMLAALVFSVASTILFLLFTKTCAQYVRRRDLAATAMSVLWLWVAMVVCLVLAIVVPLLGMQAAGAGGGGNAAAAGGIGALALLLAALVIGIIALIRYANLLLAMQAACNKFSYNATYGDEDDDDDYDDDRPRKRRRDDDDDDDDR
jgi:hypothetical protein